MSLPALWPAETLPVLRRGRSAVYAAGARHGWPVTVPVAAFGVVRTGALCVAVPATAAAETDARSVALLFEPDDAATDAPVVLVQGPAAAAGATLSGQDAQPHEVVPLRIQWWPGGNLSAAPETWVDWRPVDARSRSAGVTGIRPGVLPAHLTGGYLTAPDEHQALAIAPVTAVAADPGGLLVEVPGGVARLLRSGPARLICRGRAVVGHYDASRGLLTVARDLGARQGRGHTQP